MSLYVLKQNLRSTNFFLQFTNLDNKPAVEKLTATVMVIQGGGTGAFTCQVE